MNDALRKSLERLHDKQDTQTEKISALEVSSAKQEAALATYMKQSDRMAGELSKLNENMAVYNAELKVHIAGVIELKEMNRLMRIENTQRETLMDARMTQAEKPIGWFRAASNGLKWAAPILAAVVSIILGVLKLLGKI